MAYAEIQGRRIEPDCPAARPRPRMTCRRALDFSASSVTRPHPSYPHRSALTSELQAPPAGRAAIALLQDAMPLPGLLLVHFNDTRCGSVAELRSVIVKARHLARDDVERERAAAAAKTWLLVQIEKKRAAPASDMVETASDEPFAPERLAA